MECHWLVYHSWNMYEHMYAYMYIYKFVWNTWISCQVGHDLSHIITVYTYKQMVMPIRRTYQSGCWCDCFNSWTSDADQCEDSSQIFGRIGVIYIYVWPSHSDVRWHKSLFHETRYVWLYIVCHLPVFFRISSLLKACSFSVSIIVKWVPVFSGRYGEDDRGRRSLPDPPYIAWCRFAILIACCLWSRKTRGCLVA